MKVVTNNTLSYFWSKLKTLLTGKQDTLVSGTNIKTVQGNTLLGSGDVTLNSDNIAYNGTGGGGIAPADSMTEAVDNLIGRIDNINPNEIASVSATESSASGGNNVITITETNGTTTTFNVKNGLDGQNGQDGADGVSLGEVALVQTTGDSEESVMSQKAVTEYGRKVTTEDLNGTSEWIRAKLNEEGWEFGKYINTSGNLANNEGCCVSPYLPISMSGHKGHSLTFQYNYYIYSSWVVCFYDENKTYISGLYYQGTESNTRTVTISTSDTWDDVAYVRFTFSSATIPQCFIRDNDTGEYIWKGDEYINNLCTLCNLPVGSLNQTIGSSISTTMSQNAITNAINYNASIERGTSVQMNGKLYTRLTQEQVAMLNNSDVMSIRFMIYGSDCGNGGQDWRYTAFGSTGTQSDVFVIRMHFSGKIIVGDGVDSQTKDLVAGQPNEAIHPIIATVVLDRIRGIVRYYKNTTLITEEIAEKYKRDKFISPDGIIYFSGGDQNTRFYGVQFYDCDLQKCWRTSPVLDNEYNATISEVTPKLKYIDSSLHSFSTQLPTTWYRNGDYTKTYNSDDGSYTMTKNGGAAGNFWFTNYGPSYGMMYEIIFTSDKQFHLIANYSVSSVLYDMSGNIITTCTSTSYESIPAGKYRLEIYCLTAASGIYVEEANATITLHSYRRRFIGCIAHFDFTTLYSGKLYDDISKQFYTLYSNSSCTTVSTQHTLSQLPIRGTYIMGNLSVPHYVGEIKVTGGKAYIADNTWTWKQINNS